MKKILVVDDDPVIVALVKSRLESHGYEILTATDGQEALQSVQVTKPDLIVMDIMMPNMDGGSAVRILNNNENTKAIPVVFLTAFSSQFPNGSEAQGINVDGRNYPTVAKPFDPDHLIKVIYQTIK